jgi:hypothetical protein
MILSFYILRQSFPSFQDNTRFLDFTCFIIDNSDRSVALFDSIDISFINTETVTLDALNCVQMFALRR